MTIREILIIVVLFLTTFNCLITYLCSYNAIKCYTVKKDYSKAVNRLRNYDTYILNSLILITSVIYVGVSYFYFKDILKVSDFFMSLSILLGFILTLLTVFFSRLCYCYACNIILKTKLNEYECFMENMFSLVKIFYPMFIVSFIVPSIYLIPININYRHIILALFLLVFILIYINSISMFNILTLKAKKIKDNNLLDKLNKILKENEVYNYRLYYWDSSRSNDSNAMVTGFNKVYLFISTSLIETLNDNELEAVVLHEIGHIKNNHIKKGVIIQFCLLSIIALVFYLLIVSKYYNFYVFLGLLLTFILFMGLEFKMSKRNEDKADKYVASKGKQEYLIQALKKITIDDSTSILDVHKSIKDRENNLKY